jgi:hypothetical protein
MRKKPQYLKFILLFFSLFVLGLATGCTRSASKEPTEVPATQTPVIVVQRETVIVEVSGEAPSPVPPDPTVEAVSRFTDIQTTYYVYDQLVWAYVKGLIEACGPTPAATEVPEPTLESSPTAEETAEASPAPEESKAEATAVAEEQGPAPVPICPERHMIWGEIYVSSDRFIHQDADYEPVASTNITFKDKGISIAVAAAAEDLARNRAIPRFFFCNWPSTQFTCWDKPATRVHGAIMVEMLAHLDKLFYDPDPGEYTGSWLDWDPLPRQSELPYPDCAFSYGLTEEEAHACVAIGVDKIYLQRSASSDFGPDEPLTVAVWAEWLYNTFQEFGPPKQVPVIAPSSP